MAGMSRNNSTSSLQGFSVFQPALGSTLQWLPALGSYELDEMVHAFLPGPASIQDKRAHISMDFYEFSRQTGETFKFYPVYSAAFASFTPTTTSTASPASSTAMHDSGYGSTFNASPAVSAMSPWTPSLSASTPASAAADPQAKSRSGPAQPRTSSGSRKQLDFSNHPGMRILTKDGRDITNSASRGCKSKEQRDHAHLMRIIKACDACRRKKIRCDPSHKKRTSLQPQPARSAPREARKAKLAAHEPLGQDLTHATPDFTDFVSSFETQLAPADAFEGLSQEPDDFWQQFVHFDDQSVPFPGGRDFYLNPSGYATSRNASSSVSPTQSFPQAGPPFTEVHGVLPDPAGQEPILPYLNPEDTYGTNYQDFNLYSPTSELDGLDEEWQPVAKPRRRRTHTSKQYDVLESYFSRAEPESPDSASLAGMSCGQNHQHGKPQGTARSDLPSVYAGHANMTMPDAISRSPHSNTHSLTVSEEHPQPRVLPSSLLQSRVSPQDPAGMLPLDAGTLTAAFAMSTRRVTLPTPSLEPASERLYSSSADGLRPRLLPGWQIGYHAAGTPSTGLAQASVSHIARTGGDPSPTVQPEEDASADASAPARHRPASISLRRGLFCRSAFVLEPNDYSDVVAPDRTPSSLCSRCVSQTSVGDYDTSGAYHPGSQPLVAGLREAPHADYAPSASGLLALPTRTAPAHVLPLPSSTARGVPGASIESCHPPTPGTAAPALHAVVTLNVLFYLLSMLMRWSCLAWQRQILFALCWSVSSCAYPLHKRTMNGVLSAATKPNRLVQHSFLLTPWLLAL